MFDKLDAKDLVRRMPFWTLVILRLFRRRLNHHFFAPLLCRAYERGVINSHQLHALHRHFDPTQNGVIGQV